MTGQFELTEEVFDAVGAPLLVAFALTSLESQLEALLDIEVELHDALVAWEPVMRVRAVDDLRRGIKNIRDVLDRLESALPEVTE